MEYWKGMEIPDEAKVKAIYPDGTTKEFTTMLDAANECGVGVGSVYNCIQTGGRTRAGYKFERLINSIETRPK